MAHQPSAEALERTAIAQAMAAESDPGAAKLVERARAMLSGKPGQQLQPLQVEGTVEESGGEESVEIVEKAGKRSRRRSR